uniref:Midkine n=1 Tax=Suricata suricatta TaxID=37032 RepID=A0A673V8K8_SURSU
MARCGEGGLAGGAQPRVAKQKDKVKKGGPGIECSEWTPSTLKKVRYNTQCQETIFETKPCTPKTRAKAKAKKGKGKDWSTYEHMLSILNTCKWSSDFYQG